MKTNKAQPNENVLLVGFPGSGLIGTFTVSYIQLILKPYDLRHQLLNLGSDK
jgi:predicted ATP-grasp superfamily ATP-dependent carboligase